MELTNLTQFIPENLMIVIAAAYVVGIFLKKLENVKDKYITLILMLFCITFSVLLNLINTEYSVMYNAIVNAVLQGILCWGVSVGINQTAKQLNKQE
jgi:hypothetical protein